MSDDFNMNEALNNRITSELPKVDEAAQTGTESNVNSACTNNAYSNNAYQSNAYQGNAYQGNAYQGNAYQSNAAQGNAYQNAAQGNAYQNAENTYRTAQTGYQNTAGYQSAKTAKPKKQKTKKSGGSKYWVKVVCTALVFGLVAGAVFEGIHLAGNAVSGSNTETAAAVTEQTSASKGQLEIVKVSSTPVETIEATDVSDIVKEVMPSIVSVSTIVETTTQDFFGRVYSQEGQGAGSGFIFSQDDQYLYIATNNHVIEDSKSISVTFNDGTSADAVVRGTDVDADVAVVQIDMSSLSDETKNAIKVAVLGDSDALEAGNGAIAIGNALGYGQSVTTGAISAVNREVQLTDGVMTLIQTSAAINPGNSGGPLMNAKGEVVGINTVKYSETTVEGMGFAIPINSAVETINAILSGEQTAAAEEGQAYFGIKGGDVTESVSEQTGYPQGVYVSYVYANSAAATAGIQSGDIIVGFDGKTISTIKELQETLLDYKPGDVVTVDVYIYGRDGSYQGPQTLTTVLGSKADAPTDY